MARCREPKTVEKGACKKAMLVMQRSTYLTGKVVMVQQSNNQLDENSGDLKNASSGNGEVTCELKMIKIR